jgi:multiple sugar transport system permease protein
MKTASQPLSESTFRNRFLSVWVRIKNPIFYIVLFFWAILCLAPLYFTLVYSLKPVANAYTPPFWFPTPFTLDNFRTVLQSC